MHEYLKGYQSIIDENNTNNSVQTTYVDIAFINFISKFSYLPNITAILFSERHFSSYWRILIVYQQGADCGEMSWWIHWNYLRIRNSLLVLIIFWSWTKVEDRKESLSLRFWHSFSSSQAKHVSIILEEVRWRPLLQSHHHSWKLRCREKTGCSSNYLHQRVKTVSSCKYHQQHQTQTSSFYPDPSWNL